MGFKPWPRLPPVTRFTHLGRTVTESLNIAQVTPSLGIGGVENYLCRLTSGLTAQAHGTVMLVQKPGAWADRAAAAGAVIVQARFASDGVESATRELKARGVDLVHAHNYRAARFARRVAASMGVPYLMTVHGPRPWWKRALFRDWSETVLTVSEADRNDITGPLGVAPERVEVGVLAVDTEQFTPHTDGSPFRRALGAPPNCPLIVHVSRFSRRKARPALNLIAAMPTVRAEVPAATLILVGGGPQRKRVAKAAAALNHRLGDQAALSVGFRDDVAQVLAAGDVAVATATVALEAIACGVPTIAFGRTGYFGLVTAENFQLARAVCFADHGRLPAADAAGLAAELIPILRERDASRRAARPAAELVVRDHSVRRMSDDMIEVYRRVLSVAPAGLRRKRGRPILRGTPETRYKEPCDSPLEHRSRSSPL